MAWQHARLIRGSTAEHDFRCTPLNPQYTLNECRAFSSGRCQATGAGGSIKANNMLLVGLKGSKTLNIRLTVEKVRHLINSPGQQLAVARGPAFREPAIHIWQVSCDQCQARLGSEFAMDASLGRRVLALAVKKRIHELSWSNRKDKHPCPKCQ